MRICCERCPTVHEIDEKLLPIGGAPFQCTWCNHVFTVFPPQAAGRTAVFYPPPYADPVPPVAPARAASPAPMAGPAAVVSAAPAVELPSPAQEPHRAPAPEKSPPEQEAPRARPAARSGAPMVSRPDTISTFAARQRSRTRWRWLGPLLAVTVGTAGYGAWSWHSRRIAPAAIQKRGEGLALLARDDGRSLERAAEVFGEALAIDGKIRQARADRSLAFVLLASDAREQVHLLETDFRKLEAERLRIEQERGLGWKSQVASLIEKMRAIESQLEPLHGRVHAIEGEAFGALRQMARERAADVSVDRALAMYFALRGDAEQCAKLLRSARGAGEQDPWFDIAEGAVELRVGNSAEKRREARAKLEQVVATHPELLRARMLLARAQSDLEQTEESLRALDALLEANPEHEAARALRGEIAALLAARSR